MEDGRAAGIAQLSASALLLTSDMERPRRTEQIVSAGRATLSKRQLGKMANIEILEEALHGVKLIEPFVHGDQRGALTKTFHVSMFQQLGIDFRVSEEYYSTSAEHVLRGMHFQLPPHGQAKLVYCVQGGVLDVVVDLRKESPTFGQHAAFTLSADNRHVLYVPSGMAHGFLSLSDGATVVCKADAVYAATHDSGIHWNSFGFDWPCDAPILSEKDKILPGMNEFESPFL